jgi:hypothetical protein
MLEAKQINSSFTLEFFSISVWKDGAFSYSSFTFKLVEMVKWKASLNSQCLLYWRGETIKNNLTNMLCQRGWNFGCHLHWTLFDITKHYTILKL